MSDSPSEPDLVAPTGSATLPGNRLREAREAAGLGVMDVAQQLHLSPNVITSLEADDYSDLAGTTYVAGYLRSYARRLNLDESDITAHLPQTPQPSEAIVLDTVETMRAPRRSRKGLVLLILIIILLGLLAAGAWWLSRSVPNLIERSAVVAPEPRPVVPDRAASATTDRKVIIDLPTTHPSVANTYPVEQSTETTTVEHDENVLATEAETAGMAADSAGIPAGGDTSSGESTVVSSPVADRPAANSDVARVDSVSQPNNETQRGTPVEPASLEMAFHHDSWTEVRDNRGKLLVFQVVKAGSLLELAGEPPISVVLGYAPGVSITYNDRPFDLSAHTRNDVARFKVGVAP